MTRRSAGRDAEECWDRRPDRTRLTGVAGGSRRGSRSAPFPRDVRSVDGARGRQSVMQAVANDIRENATRD